MVRPPENKVTEPTVNNVGRLCCLLHLVHRTIGHLVLLFDETWVEKGLCKYGMQSAERNVHAVRG